MKIRVVDQLYLICLSLGIIFTAISLTMVASQLAWVQSISNSVLLGLCLVQILRTFYLLRNKTRWMLSWCFGFSVFLVSYLIADDRTLFEAFVYATGAIFVDYNKIIKTMKSTWIWCALTVVALSLVNIIPTNTGFRETGIPRMSLGFVHPNTLGFVCFIIGLLLLIDSYKKVTRNNIIKLLLLTLVAYFIANSRTSSILLLALDIVMIAKVFRNSMITTFLKKRWMYTLVAISVIGLVGFTLWIATSYSGTIKQMMLNRFLNNRAQNGAYYMSLYGISLFGRSIPEFVLWSDNFTQLYLDNGYLLMLIKYGVIAATLYIMMILQAAKKAAKNRDAVIIMAIVLVALSLFAEQSALRWCFCPILMYPAAVNGDKTIK